MWFTILFHHLIFHLFFSIHSIPFLSNNQTRLSSTKSKNYENWIVLSQKNNGDWAIESKLKKWIDNWGKVQDQKLYFPKYFSCFNVKTLSKYQRKTGLKPIRQRRWGNTICDWDKRCWHQHLWVREPLNLRTQIILIWSLLTHQLVRHLPGGRLIAQDTAVAKSHNSASQSILNFKQR